MKKSIFLLTALTPLLGASCFGLGDSISQKISEETTEKFIESATNGSNVEIDANGDEVRVTGEDGSELHIGGGELPQNFPSQVPLYSDAAVESSFTSTDPEEGSSWTITLSSGDSVETPRNFYETAFTTDGWTITYSYTLDDSYGFTAENGNTHVTVTISANDENGSDIFMNVVEEVVEEKKAAPDDEE